MPKIKNPLPSSLLITAQVYTRLGRNKQGLWQSGVSEFLEYHQVGKVRLYLAEDVAKMKYWLFVREGLLALGIISKYVRLLPPGETYEARRNFFEAWVDEDPSGATCPQCDGDAVRGARGEGPIWCPKCGVQNE